MLPRTIALALAAATLPACVAPEPDPAAPAVDGPLAAAPERPPAAPAPTGSLSAPTAADASFPDDPEAQRVGRAILDCDTHLRSWMTLMAQPRDRENQEKINTLTAAIGTLVAKHRAILEAQAVSGPPRNRGIASAALGFTSDPSVLPYLVNNASDGDAEIAAKALLGLGVLAEPSTPAAVLQDAALRPNATAELTSNAAFALFQISIRAKADADGGLTDAGLTLLQSPDATVRAQAALSLGLVKAGVAQPQLADVLTADPEPFVRTAAAYALGQLGARESTAALVRALSDPDKVTAGAAHASLKRIHGRDLGASPAAWRAVGGM